MATLVAFLFLGLVLKDIKVGIESLGSEQVCDVNF